MDRLIALLAALVGLIALGGALLARQTRRNRHGSPNPDSRLSAKGRMTGRMTLS